jgi:alpha/beta superfamily hydrolase
LIEQSAVSLQNADFATFQFDFYGSGESDGWFKDKRLSILEDNCKDALSFFRNIPAIDSTRVGIWGRSIGGTLAALFSSEVNCSVIISPGFLITKSFASWNNVPMADGYVALPSEQYTPQRQKDIKGDWKLNTRYFEELAYFEDLLEENAPKGRNVMLIQGKEDKTVDWEDTRVFYRLFGVPKQLVLIRNADHSYIGCEKSAISCLVGWFNLCLTGLALEI